MGRPATRDERKAIRSRYEAGESVQAIAVAMGLEEGVVGRVVGFWKHRKAVEAAERELRKREASKRAARERRLAKIDAWLKEK